MIHFYNLDFLEWQRIVFAAGLVKLVITFAEAEMILPIITQVEVAISNTGQNARYYSNIDWTYYGKGTIGLARLIHNYLCRVSHVTNEISLSELYDENTLVTYS